MRSAATRKLRWFLRRKLAAWVADALLFTTAGLAVLGAGTAVRAIGWTDAATSMVIGGVLQCAAVWVMLRLHEWSERPY
ncbi:hypothetical protein [Alkalilimnicola sp. S0819]|uniref:hypothetical protein n=1 Tax=Alkalilimnicola sp. S0819 TaxID=2613922 RepID=UPI0012617200|nr:hypothetical protein [Alkalilimnicola sp. S0819]KAB7624336.1 hypothetical protein F3N43_05880 [Alkalilimnicola sp. S0819]MPQ16161.1 hypothetical protein [Alkalilimnicola sp. S0819]